MELQRASVLYTCENTSCRAIRGYHLNTVGATFNETMRMLESHKECHACKKTMKLTHVILTKVKEDFGDPKFGMWECQHHRHARFYPIPLKRAFKDRDYTNNLYELIVEVGLPLRCPFCQSLLDYIDERVLACGYY